MKEDAMETPTAVDAVRQVPFVRHSGIDILAAGPGWAIASLEQRKDLTSHLGSFQGAALYGVAETAVSAVLARLVQDALLSTYITITGSAISFDRPGYGRVTAHAALSESSERVRARLARDGATALAVVVRLRDAEGAEIGSAEFSCRMTARRPAANEVAAVG
jgi:acyl-coenzyme A thioesterase PaaI-like protein